MRLWTGKGEVLSTFWILAIERVKIDRCGELGKEMNCRADLRVQSISHLTLKSTGTDTCKL